MNQMQRLGYGMLIGIMGAIVPCSESAVAQAIEQETSATVSTGIPQLGDFDAATTVEEWVAQTELYLAQSLIQVVGIQVDPTETGLEVILETAEEPLAAPSTSVVGNALIADFPNAVLALPDGEEFQQTNPVEGIALITVTPRGNGIRVAITGVDAPPTATVGPEAQAFVLSVTPGTEAAATEEDVIQVVVTGAQDEGYNPSSATTATRTDTPIRDIPQSIQVIPRQVLEDQQVTRLQDALQNVSGLTRWGNYGGNESGAYTIRGFYQEGNFRNGFRDNDFYSISDPANIERIEVLRGPSSVLFGQAQPGGIINIITEQPLDEPYYSLEFTGGQFSFYRPELDISGPITDDGDLRYRLNLAYQNSGSFRDFNYIERVFVAPVLAWDIGDNTTLTANFEYLYNDPVFDRGLVALSDGSLVLPINRYLGYPDLENYTETVYRGGYNFEHRFSDSWRIRNALSIYSARAGGDSVGLAGGLIDDRFLPRSFDVDNFINENYALQTEVVGEFTTGSIAHELLMGVELNRRTRYYYYLGGELPPIDIFDPDYDVERPDELASPYNEITSVDTVGIYLQDQINLLDNLILLVGGRFDSLDQDTYYPYDGSSVEQSDSAFSPRVGVVYQPSEEIALYASYSEGFFPNIGRSADNSAFDPERGRQYEIGVKGDFLDGRLSGTLAAFDITKSNVLTTDPDNVDFSIAVGEQRSQGVELNITGEVLPGWNIIAGYAYIDARVTEDNSIPEGDRPQNVAEHTANLWTTYEIQEGDFQGLGFGLGLFFIGEREGELPNTNFELPSFLRADAALFYRRDNWRVGVNVRNLFDIEYYETAQGNNVVYPGAPINVLATVSVEF
jgi:iron complex outermembrane recepter protein